MLLVFHHPCPRSAAGGFLIGSVSKGWVRSDPRALYKPDTNEQRRSHCERERGQCIKSSIDRLIIHIALHPVEELVSSHEIADRLQLPGRSLEPVLQALAREGILAGVRGARGGYKLAKARGAISVYDISEAVRTVETEEPKEFPGLLGSVVVPMLADAEAELETRLKRITVDDLVRAASLQLLASYKAVH